MVTLLVHLQVYADRYLELLDSPPELSAPEDNTSNFHISVRMSSPDVGPYACLVFHDPVGTPLTIGELQQQFSGSYSDFSTSQVMNSSERQARRLECELCMHTTVASPTHGYPLPGGKMVYNIKPGGASL